MVEPIVKRPHYRFEIRKKDTKVGRGFSLKELKEAGLTVQEAKKLGVRIDKRRKTSYPENVEALKKLEEQLKEKKQAQ
ncbi:50S ribosomal protein L13e [Sulfolobus sp. S-194]|uniref:50S ribosomal protein L13e n=1 Tax=Sulfolobus sp. S-194 TaxID=2512240 RepID=UPI001437375A|nr:50S ribosomal protein L13e [Sulfolobus sp. S-194]QIW23566.1 50S ribosomal protein L13e [Sulfolobus sp. S-194]